MSNQAYYKTPEHKKWRRSVYKRDGFVCKWPGCACNKDLEAHHIRKLASHPELRSAIDNGITLCEEHHRLTFDCEEKYESMFIEIISKMNKSTFDIKRFMYFGEN